MATGIAAAFLAVLVWSFVEGLGRFYPAKAAWRRLRTVRGRRAVRAMRERFEEAARRKTGRKLATVLLCLLAVWVASASLLDKRWYEVVADSLPSLIVLVALLRVPAALAAIAERMKDYEREAGEDPDSPLGGDLPDGDSDVIAL
jgi:hypothetical protein